MQMKVIFAFATGHDVFAVLPTGFGKSLCYARLPGMFDHLLQPEEPSLVIVVTPLTAIMEGQAVSLLCIHVATYTYLKCSSFIGGA